jgi:peptidoglycan/LPS O-acetylase OafA/YrhL
MEAGYLFSACCLLFVYLRGLGLWREVPPAALVSATIFGALWIPLTLAPMRSSRAFAGEDYPLDRPLWSLFGEVIALYGLLLHTARIRVLAGFILVSWLVLLGMTLHSPTGWGGTELARGVGWAISGFLTGVILLRSFRAGRLQALPSVNPLLIFAIWFSVCCIPYKPPMTWFGAVVATMGAPLAMMFLIRTERSTPKLFRWLGRVSYPLYVSHFGFVWIALAFLPHNVEGHNILWAVPMTVASLCVAWRIAKLTEASRKDRAVLAAIATGPLG